MRRVVVTGFGIVSSIGNNRAEVLDSLRNGRSGIRFNEEYKELGFRSHVYGSGRDRSGSRMIDRKLKRFMSDSAGYNYVAMLRSDRAGGLSEESDISSPRTGVIVGFGRRFHGERVLDRRHGAPERRPQGRSLHGDALHVVRDPRQPRHGLQGEGRQLHHQLRLRDQRTLHRQWRGADPAGQAGRRVRGRGGGAALGHLGDVRRHGCAESSKYNDTPGKASRTYDAERDGFVISGGGGIMILEELEHARARGADIICELVGYGATSDGADMVQPSGEGAMRCMRMALEDVEGPVDYLNTHGTSTPVGDIKELEAIREVFGAESPPIASTKSLAGHALGAAGVNEAVHCLLMMQHDFIAASANIERLDPAAEGFDIVRERRDGARLDTVMSNSFGFGGTNATLVFRRWA
jgi:3-oxoacyl-[acyl-carrier-protein] synthase I